MRVFLFRHAEKEMSMTSDPPLSKRGHRQVQLLTENIQKQNFPYRPDLLLTSPKRRAHQSFWALHENLKIPLKVLPELDERQNSETSEQFFSRVKNQVTWMSTQNKILFLVTHLDWIEEALITIPSTENLSHSKYQAWAPMQYMGFDIHEGYWHVTHYGRIDL